MLTQDLQIINDVRLLSLKAGIVYDDLATRLSGQQSRNVLKRLAKHRMEIVKAIAMEEGAAYRCEQLSEFVPEEIRYENNARDTASIVNLITREKREITYLRNEVKKIKNYTLRCRLSSFVATLQIDFDQLQSLATVQKENLKGDGNV